MQHSESTQTEHARAGELSDDEEEEDDEDESHYELCRERTETPPFETSSDDLPHTLSKQALEQDLEDL